MFFSCVASFRLGSLVRLSITFVESLGRIKGQRQHRENEALDSWQVKADTASESWQVTARG